MDRDCERFTDETLEGFAALFVGRPVLRDHNWETKNQTARVYAAGVEPMDGASGGKQLVLRCYMVRTAATADIITAIEAGILRECSVGVAVKEAVCSVCGVNQRTGWCEHRGGVEYDGATCFFELRGAEDAYEVSLVAVPAQPEAGIVKSKRYGGPESPEQDPTGGAPGGMGDLDTAQRQRVCLGEDEQGSEPRGSQKTAASVSGLCEDEDWQDEALLELEKNRF